MSETETALISCGTSTGPFQMKLERAMSPMGYDRAVELFERGFYDNTHFFRVIPKFLVQFGITYSTSDELKHFAKNQIPDDPQLDPPTPFREGTISYAGSGDNSRTSQLFISYGDSKQLGTQKWETPIGHVVEGMDNIRNLYTYGDMPPWGKGPAQGKIYAGRSYIEDNFPLLDHFQSCTVERTFSEDGNEAAVDEDSSEDEDDQEDWSATAVKKDAVLVDGGGATATLTLKDKLTDKYQTLRSKVKETDTEFDVMAMGALLLVIILAALAKMAMRPKKTTSKTN